MNYFKKFSDNSHAIFFAILTCLLVSIFVSIVKYLSFDFHPFFIVFMRNLFGFLFFLPLIIKTKAQIFKTKTLNLHIIRGLNGWIGMLIWFYVVNLIALPELIAMTFLVPIVTTLGAMVFLHEKVSKNIWFSLITGFFGILFITRPGFRELNYGYLLMLTVPFSWSFTNLLIKKMTKTEKPKVIVLYMSTIMFLFSIPLGFIFYQEVNIEQLFWFIALGVLSSLSHVTMSHAFSKADLSVVQPFDFLRLIFTSIIAYFAFGQKLDIYTFIGSIIIMIGVIFLAPKRKKKNAYSDELNDI